MRKSLHCNRCGARLSAPLVIASGKDPAIRKPEAVDRQPLVARGLAFKSWEPQSWLHTGPGHPLHFAPQYWLNPDDLTRAVRDTPVKGRLGGCCGVTGLNGPNQVCECRAEVGTLQDGCMTPRVFIPEPEATNWHEGDEDDRV